MATRELWTSDKVKRVRLTQEQAWRVAQCLACNPVTYRDSDAPIIAKGWLEDDGCGPYDDGKQRLDPTERAYTMFFDEAGRIKPIWILPASI